jgi:hypothetical protein
LANSYFLTKPSDVSLHYLANLVQELRIGELPILARLIALPVQCDLVPISSLDVAVNSIVAYVGFASFEPLVSAKNN